MHTANEDGGDTRFEPIHADWEVLLAMPEARATRPTTSSGSFNTQTEYAFTRSEGP